VQDSSGGGGVRDDDKSNGHHEHDGSERAARGLEVDMPPEDEAEKEAELQLTEERLSELEDYAETLSGDDDKYSRIKSTIQLLVDRYRRHYSIGESEEDGGDGDLEDFELDMDPDEILADGVAEAIRQVIDSMRGVSDHRPDGATSANASDHPSLKRTPYNHETYGRWYS